MQNVKVVTECICILLPFHYAENLVDFALPLSYFVLKTTICPAGINIGLVNRLLDAGGDSAAQYAAMPVKASACTGCGACEERCPFQVKGIGRMQQAAKAFEGI